MAVAYAAVVIVVVGHPAVFEQGPPWRPAGTAALAAMAAARRGSQVQLVGKVGDDDPGDALLVELARAEVGHAALLRDPARPTPRHADAAADESVDIADDDPGGRRAPGGSLEGPMLEPADVDLGLRYFTDFRVLLAAEPLAEAILSVVVDAARYASASLILVTLPGNAASGRLPDGAVVLEQPAEASGDGFATLLGEVAAAIDAGRAPEDALAAAASAVGAVRPSS